MKRLLIVMLSALFALLLASCTSEDESSDGGAERELRIQIDPAGNEVEMMKTITRQFTERTGIAVKTVVGPAGSSERLNLYRQLFGARSADMDIYQLDIIWPGIFAQHLEDMTPVLGDDAENFLEETLNASQVSGRLVSVPFFINVGVLFYRPSLLQKYGYEDPPTTYEELETMAAAITEGERAAGNDDFWGFVWQGRSYEGLTCNAIEWIASEGGEYFDENGEVTIDSDASVRALERAARWPGWISSPDVVNWMESHGEKEFTNGNAAFLRAWPTAGPRILESAIAGDFAVAPLPSGSARPAASLGGWGLGVSSYSPMKEEAKEFVKFLVSPEILKLRAVEGGLIPPRPDLYLDPEVQEALPTMNQYTEILAAAVARPSTTTQDRYGEVSAVLFTEVHAVLIGKQTAQEALHKIETKTISFME